VRGIAERRAERRGRRRQLKSGRPRILERRIPPGLLRDRTPHPSRSDDRARVGSDHSSTVPPCSACAFFGSWMDRSQLPTTSRVCTVRVRLTSVVCSPEERARERHRRVASARGCEHHRRGNCDVDCGIRWSCDTEFRTRGWSAVTTAGFGVPFALNPARALATCNDCAIGNDLDHGIARRLTARRRC
jgi:hypothetical protein